MNRLHLLVGLLLLVPSGCAHWRGTSPRLTLADQSLELLPPASYGTPEALLLHLQGAGPDGEFEMNLQMEVDRERWVIAGLSRVGFRGFLMQWQAGEAIEVDRRFGVSVGLKPNRLLLALQCALWPPSAFTRAWPGVTAQETPTGFQLLHQSTRIVDVSNPGPGTDRTVDLPPEQIRLTLTVLEREPL